MGSIISYDEMMTWSPEEKVDYIFKDHQNEPIINRWMIDQTSSDEKTVLNLSIDALMLLDTVLNTVQFYAFSNFFGI